MRAYLNLAASALTLALGVVPAQSRDYGKLACNTNAIPDIYSDDCISDAVPFSELVLQASLSSSSRVVVPCGTCAYMDYTDSSTITLPPDGLDVVGRLHFPSTASLVLNTTAVMVQGMLDMTIPDAGNQVTITLYGTDEQFVYPHNLCGGKYDASCSDRISMGKKPIAVVGGKLKIQAVDPDCPSWTKLKTASGDDVGQTRHFHVDPAFAACITPGEELLITSQSLSHTDERVRKVESVRTDSLSGDAIITVDGYFTQAFATEAGPGEADYAVEVAGFRRDVIFQAQKDDPNPMHGGHLIVFHTPSIVQTISGVAFYHFGQDGNLGRYPIHFHLSGDTASTVSKNLIRNSNQRCIVIHETNKVTIHDNVAYNCKGHCFATETGKEKFNKFTYNLGARGKKLAKGFGQSDTPGFSGHHLASTFWIKSMMNTFIGNVAAGSNSMGFWFELRDITTNQLSTVPGSSSFRDNVAHSNFQGLVTYKKGWKPKNGGLIENFKTYKNAEGLKFHISGNFVVKDSLIADNVIGVRYGVWNSGVTLKDTLIVARSRDAKLRMKRNCPITLDGIRPSFNRIDGQIKLENVTFQNFICGKKTIAPYYDNRLSNKAMGDSIVSSNVSIENSDESSKPTFGCGLQYSEDAFMEDNDGTLGPSGKGPGFIIKNNKKMKAFLPPGQCETISYGGRCSAFCENVCFRKVNIKPSAKTSNQLVLFNGSTTYSFSKSGSTFTMALPSGQYHGYFLDDNGKEVIGHSVEVVTFQAPLCNDYVKKSSFMFSTFAPTPSPSSAPTISASPSTKPPPVVRLRSSFQRYIFAKSDGKRGLRRGLDPVSQTSFTLVPLDSCGKHAHKDLSAIQCFTMVISGQNSRRLYAGGNGAWTARLGTVPQGSTLWPDQFWYFEYTSCGEKFTFGASCVFIRNASNGRSLYDHDGKIFGASPSGDVNKYPYIISSQYKWEKILV